MKRRDQRKTIGIIGAGPTGLSVAWHLAREGHTVKVFEKEPQPGGLCRTFSEDGFYFDFGPHVLHTCHEDIIDFLKRILGDHLVAQNFKVKIFFNNQMVDYPVKGLKALKVLRWPQKISAVIDLILARIFMFIRDPKNDDSFEEWITHRFGRTLYNVYFGPYAEKAWKISPRDVSAYVSRKRVPIISITEYVRALCKLKPKPTTGEFGTKMQTFYPKYGVGEVVDFFLKELRGLDCEILTGTTVTAIKREGNRIKQVAYDYKGSSQLFDVDFLVNSIAINDFCLLMDPLPESEIKEAAESLDFCSERLLYIKINKEKIFDVPLVYFQSPKIPFNRVYDVRSFSASCVPTGKTALCVEFTCSKGDPTWEATPEELFKQAMDVFSSNGILDPIDVSGYIVKNLTHAYPRFRVGFEARLQKIFSFFAAHHNMITLGRQGLFCYANVDEVLLMGFRAVEFFHNSEYMKVDYYSIFKEFVDHE